jgi:hypothetical protein
MRRQLRFLSGRISSGRVRNVLHGIQNRKILYFVKAQMETPSLTSTVLLEGNESWTPQVKSNC